ncbi:hypothetical protein [Alkalihalobacillus sp. R86527]|uniref:hypothetical protein n=1 Tax=Alkalihalobacillus sp. R86527 TaxID=3093863 RepID=UPI00366B1FDF
MIKRIIVGKEVYYKVAELTNLFGVSLYKVKKAIDKQKIHTRTLDGLGRVKFISEDNLAKLEIDGERQVATTIVETEVNKETVETVEPKKNKGEKTEKKHATKANKQPKKKSTDKSKSEYPKAIVDEHKKLLKDGRTIVLPFAKTKNMDTVHEICKKHLDSELFTKTTPKDIEPMRAVIAELNAASVNLPAMT